MRRVLTTKESAVRHKLVFGAALLAVACTLLVPAPASGQKEKLSSFLKGRVTFTLPDGWPVYMYTNGADDGAAELRDFYPDSPEGKLHAQAFMTAELAHEFNTLKEEIEERRRSRPKPRERQPGEAVLSDTFDGVNWYTSAGVSVSYGRRYLTFSRSGLVNHKRFGIGISFPLEGVSPEMIRRVVADFNAMCESLKIDGQNKFESKLDADKILKVLETDEKNDDSEDRNNRR